MSSMQCGGRHPKLRFGWMLTILVPCILLGQSEVSTAQSADLAWPDAEIVAELRATLRQYYAQTANSDMSHEILAPISAAELSAAPKDPDTLWAVYGQAFSASGHGPATDCHGAVLHADFVDCTGARLASVAQDVYGIRFAEPYEGGLTLADDRLGYYSLDFLVRTAGQYALYHAFVRDFDAPSTARYRAGLGAAARQNREYHERMLAGYEAHMRSILVAMFRKHRDDAFFQLSFTRGAGWLVPGYAWTVQAMEEYGAWVEPSDRANALALINGLAQRIWWEWVQPQPEGPRTAGMARIGDQGWYDRAVVNNPGLVGMDRFVQDGVELPSLRSESVAAPPHDGLWFDADYTVPGEWACIGFGIGSDDWRRCQSLAKAESLGGRHSPFGEYFGEGNCDRRASSPTSVQCGETNLGSMAEEWLATYVGARAAMRLMERLAASGDTDLPVAAVGPGGAADVAELRAGFGVAGWHGGEGRHDDLEWTTPGGDTVAIRTLSAGSHDAEIQNGRYSLGELDVRPGVSDATNGDTSGNGGSELPGAIENHMPGPNALYAAVLLGQVLSDKVDGAPSASLFDAQTRNQVDEFSAWLWLLQSGLYACPAGHARGEEGCLQLDSPNRVPLFHDPADASVALPLRYLWRRDANSMAEARVAAASDSCEAKAGLPWVAVGEAPVGGSTEDFMLTEYGYGAYNLLLQSAGGFMRLASSRANEEAPPEMETAFAREAREVLAPWHAEMRQLVLGILRLYRHEYGYVPDIENAHCMANSTTMQTWRAGVGEMFWPSMLRRAHWYSVAAQWYWWYDSGWLDVDGVWGVGELTEPMPTSSAPIVTPEPSATLTSQATQTRQPSPTRTLRSTVPPTVAPSATIEPTARSTTTPTTSSTPSATATRTATAPVGHEARWNRGPDGPPRAGHSIVYDSASDAYWLFGGRDTSAPIVTYSNELYRMAGDLSGGWQQVATRGVVPPSMMWHSAAYDSDLHQVLVTGGRTRTGRSDELLLLSIGDGEQPLWISQRIDQARGGPPGLYQHASVYLPEPLQQLLVVGGFSAGASANDDMYLFSTADFRWQDAGRLDPRSMLALAFDEVQEMLYAFGGTNTSSLGSGRYFGLDAARVIGSVRDNWATVLPGIERAGSEMAWDAAGRRLWILGGHADDGVVDELIQVDVDLEPMLAKSLALTPSPGPLMHHASAWDSRRDRWLVQGGSTALEAEGQVRATWILEPER